MHIIGIDPSSKFFGVAILRVDSDKIHLLLSKCFSPNGKTHPEKINDATNQVKLIISNIDILEKNLVLAVESGFAHRNIRVTQTLAYYVGSLMSLSATLKAKWISVPPKSAKLALTGNGAASKSMMIECAKDRFKLCGNVKSEITEHEADAIGCAVFAQQSLSKLE